MKVSVGRDRTRSALGGALFGQYISDRCSFSTIAAEELPQPLQLRNYSTSTIAAEELQYLNHCS